MSVIVFTPPIPLSCPLWPFASAIYNQPGVADHLLALQTRQDIWINDWLFALWQAHKGNTLRMDFRDRIEGWTGWRTQVIVPWRAQRAALKIRGGTLYANFKVAELALEWHDQYHLSERQSELTEPAPAGTPPEQCLALSLQRVSDSSAEVLAASVSLLLRSTSGLPTDSANPPAR